MKVACIRPNMVAAQSADAFPPLAFSVLAGLTPPNIELVLYDECHEPLPTHIEADLAAITCHTFSAYRSYQLADSLRNRGIPVILGGYHPTFETEEAITHADSVMVGEAEPLWEHVLKDAASRGLKKVYQSDKQVSLDGVIYKRDIFNRKRYGRIAPVEFSRGCRYKCDFCSVSAFHGHTHRTRPVSEVIAEIQNLPEKILVFIDDNLFANKEEAGKLFEALVPLKRKWGCQISIDIAQHEDLLDLMARSGCVVVMIGFESLEPNNLSQMKKGWSTRRDYTEAINRIKDRGIMIYGSFVFGYDHDTPDIFESSLKFALEHKFLLANFNTLTPMPHTRLYERLRGEGRLVEERWWLFEQYKYGEVMFEPRHMTRQQLKQGCLHARYEFFKTRGILKRLVDRRTNLHGWGNLGLFLLLNLLVRKELKTKMKRIDP